jgi:Na+/H+-dicarboxylate symporter
LDAIAAHAMEQGERSLRKCKGILMPRFDLPPSYELDAAFDRGIANAFVSSIPFIVMPIVMLAIALIVAKIRHML